MHPARLVEISSWVAGVDDAVGHEDDGLVGRDPAVDVQLVDGALHRLGAVGELAGVVDLVEALEEGGPRPLVERSQWHHPAHVLIESENRHAGVPGDLLEKPPHRDCGEELRIVLSHAARVVEHQDDVLRRGGRACRRDCEPRAEEQDQRRNRSHQDVSLLARRATVRRGQPRVRWRNARSKYRRV